jgi:hypothetical protein
MKQFIISGSALLILLSLMLTAAQPGAVQERLIEGNDYLIMPGKRAGAIELGNSIEQVERRIGRGTIAPRKDFQIYSFPQYMMDLSVQKEQVVTILLINRRYKTQEGICVGGSVSSVIRAYGKDYEFEEINKADCDYVIQYWEKGITFSVKDEHITRIRIFNQKMVLKQMSK